jgi:hypothetical protein
MPFGILVIPMFIYASNVVKRDIQIYSLIKSTLFLLQYYQGDYMNPFFVLYPSGLNFRIIKGLFCKSAYI